MAVEGVRRMRGVRGGWDEVGCVMLSDMIGPLISDRFAVSVYMELTQFLLKIREHNDQFMYVDINVHVGV